MSSIPYAQARVFRAVAARGALVRRVLLVFVVLLVVAAALVARQPHAGKQPLLPAKAGGVVVLDLSASITSDTYSRIHESLQQLVERRGRYGLVLFSTVAYEALPPGTPASALEPIARYFVVPTHVVQGEQPTFPKNPWSDSFTQGTEISNGLDLARSIELAKGIKHPAVLLISDLADDPNDFQRLNTVLNEYQVEHIKLRVIALNADPSDLARFRSLVGKASSIVPAGLSTNQAAPPSVGTSFPVWLVVLASVVALLLALVEVRAARLDWGSHPRPDATA